jgi:hypothetical protein
MIGYYIVILTAAMILIVIGIQVFKMLSGRKQREPFEPSVSSAGVSEQTSEELAAAAIAAVAALVGSDERGSASAWTLVETDAPSPWKIASRSRRVSLAGG